MLIYYAFFNALQVNTCVGYYIYFLNMPVFKTLMFIYGFNSLLQLKLNKILLYTCNDD